jgi:hypothetical protein
MFLAQAVDLLRLFKPNQTLSFALWTNRRHCNSALYTTRGSHVQENKPILK